MGSGFLWNQEISAVKILTTVFRSDNRLKAKEMKKVDDPFWLPRPFDGTILKILENLAKMAKIVKFVKMMFKKTA